MPIFNEHGNLEDAHHETLASGTSALWAKIEPLLEDLSSVEVRALEQAVILSISVRFGEHRIRTEMERTRKERKAAMERIEQRKRQGS
jgi:hypothetical protein